MSNKNYPTLLSECYELVKGDELMQGDILEDCPVFLPPNTIELPIDDNERSLDFQMGIQDVVIMSQSCDLKAGQKQDMWLVILCPVWKLSDAEAVSPFLATSYGKEMCRRGHLPGYHMLTKCEHKLWSREISIVSFREISSLPLGFVKTMAGELDSRPRIRSPYREHLAQAFARYFMRVGLPVDIEPFKSQKAEDQVMRKLEAMDDEKRSQILDCFK